MADSSLISKVLLSDIKSIIENGKNQAYAAVNISMLNTYWNIGRRIVEEEQHGEKRAEYGQFLAHKVADALRSDYGDAFSYRNICYYRQFYLCFNDIEIVNARVHNLTWTHIRHLLRVTDDNARMWYLQEASSQMWSTRELERNIQPKRQNCTYSGCSCLGSSIARERGVHQESRHCRIPRVEC